MNKRATVPFRRKDAFVLVGVLAIVCVLSGLLWRAASARREWRTHRGVVMTKGVVMPPFKQMAPIRYTITIRESDGASQTFEVDPAIYRATQVGAQVERDVFGKTRVLRSP